MGLANNVYVKKNQQCYGTLSNHILTRTLSSKGQLKKVGRKISPEWQLEKPGV